MNQWHVRTVFISDVHLGLRDCQATYLLDFLRSTTCEQLYLVGDIIDLENLSTSPWWHRDHGAVLDEIFRIARSGTRVIYIPGNHDAAMRRFAGQSMAGVHVELDALHIAADGRRYRVSHGDEFDRGIRAPRWLLFVGDKMQSFVCGLNRRVNALRKLLGFSYQPISIAIKSRIGITRRFIRDFEMRVAASARAAGVDGHICGHIHHGRIEDHAGVVYINDGDWVEHCTALVEHDDGAFELVHWTERRERLGMTVALANRPHVAIA